MRVSRLAIAAVATAGLALAPSERIDAQANGALAIDWYTIDAGGARSTAPSGLTLHGTIGQWDSAASSRGRLALNGGFWPGRRVDRIFSDRFEQ
jgi:hypothetical protein